MLAAEKAQLRTSLAVEQLTLREKELNFYINSMSSVSTQATLLAGFAFSQLTGYSYIEPTEGYFTKEQLETLGVHDNDADGTLKGVVGWSWLTWVSQILQLLFIISTACCMFLQLWVVQVVTVTSVKGQGLALRGPDGSVAYTTKHMASQHIQAYAYFSIGIFLAKFSTLLFIFNAFPIFLSVPTALIGMQLSYRSYNQQQVLEKLLAVRRRHPASDLSPCFPLPAIHSPSRPQRLTGWPAGGSSPRIKPWPPPSKRSNPRRRS